MRDDYPTVWVDNTAPEATADADALTEEVETVYDPSPERNGAVQLFGRTESEGDDDRVKFWVKRARDLNMEESYWAPDEGIDDSDINPDWTRPFVFDWDLNVAQMPDDSTTPPLPVGEEFHVVAVGEDFLGNAEDVTDVFADGRYVTMEIVDNVGPVPTITWVQRETGDEATITYPHLMDAVYARDFAQLHAELLNADMDAEKVEFMFMPQGGTEPTLIDADIHWSADTPFAWDIYSWDLSALAPGNYLVWARGWDDVGNYVDGPQFLLVVDYSAPEFATITPYDGMMECPHECEFDGDGGPYDSECYELIFTTTDVDIWDEAIAWEWKRAQDPDDDGNWTVIDTDILFDADTGAYAGVWNMYGLADGLYDVRLTVLDVSGNETQTIVARNVVWDDTDPDVNVTRVDVAGVQIYPALEPVDISVGDVITLTATAHDDESILPDSFETGITSMLFEARRMTGDMSWYELGVWTAPDETIFTEVTYSLDWNTTGLREGTYEVRAWADDALCNFGWSGAIELGIFDIEPPRARICGFQPWRDTHGDDRENFVDIYGCAYSDNAIWEVQFQYSEDEGETWIPIGISREGDDDGWMDTENCDLWYTTMTIDGFGVGAQFLLRGLAMDSDYNQDENPPTLLVEVIENMYGQLELVPVGDLDLVGEPVIEYRSDEDGDCYMLVTVETADAAIEPQVLMISPASEMQYPSSAYQFCVEMVRMVDNPLMWRGIFDMPYGDDEDCGRYTVFANALSDENTLDMAFTHQWTWEVTDDLGSNGVMSVPGYLSADDETYLYAHVEVPPGNDMSDYCFLIAPAWTPQVSDEETYYIVPLERTTYHLGFACDYDYADHGFYSMVTIEYDEAALLAACGGDEEAAAAKEPYLTVRRHYYDYDDNWSGEYIHQISVDTENNTVSFLVQEWDYDMTEFAIFAPKWNGPVVVRSFDPQSPYDGRWNYTDRDPVIVIDLNGFGNETEYVEEDSIELWIDGNLVATDEWIQGEDDGADFVIEEKNYDETLYQLIYTHAPTSTWWLREGWHTLSVRYQVYDDEDFGYIELPENAPGARFYVDTTAPMVQLYSGWTNDPILNNTNGYDLSGWMNPDSEHDMLTAYMYDEGAGVLVCPTDLGDEGDLQGIKYDLWLVQADRPDVLDEYFDPLEEIEHRLLLHTGTCTELEPYLYPPLVGEDSYAPGDTLFVPLPIVAGGRHHDIQDGDIIEVVFYTMKHVENDPTIHCEAGLILMPGQDGTAPDTLGSVYVDCYIDPDGRQHVYDQGILDWAGNAGAEYVEARFVVDKSAPSVELVTPAGGQVEPGEQFCFEVAVSDAGAGVDDASVRLVASDGTEIEVTEFALDDETLTGCVEGGLDTGNYTLVVEAGDLAGNTAQINVPITVQAAILAVGDAHLVPNPFNPNEYEADICFNLSRAANVTVTIFDFAGEEVSTFSRDLGADSHKLPWNATSGNGVQLANGAYLIRIEAQDGTGTKAATVKAVVWRE